MANRPAEPDADGNGAVEGDEPRPRCRLYLITPPDLAVDGPALEAFGEVLAAALDAGDVACVQLRLKDVSDDDWRRAAATLGPIVQSRDVAFILNDRADLVAELGADGAHIGQDDVGYARARQLVGDDAILGVTCKASRDLATDAAEAGADYVAFGAFFESTTKEVSKRVGLDILAWWSAVATTPAVAIGGITPENCGPAIRAGADFLAVAGGVWRHPEGPAAAVRAFNAVIDATPHDESAAWETEP